MIFLICFILKYSLFFSQASYNNYYSKNSESIEDLRNSNLNQFENRLLEYKFYFYSELHETESLGIAKAALNDFLFKQKKIEAVFMEYPVSLYSDFIVLQKMEHSDTNDLDFKTIYNNQHEEKIILKNLYKNRKYNFRIIPVDVIYPHQIMLSDFVMKFPLLKKNKKTFKDFKKLKVINFNPFITDKNKFKYYLDYKKKVIENYDLYKQVLGLTEFTKFLDMLDGIEICKDCAKNDTTAFFEQMREDFLYKNIKNEINKNLRGNYISFNGHFHTTSIYPNDCNCSGNFEVLASRIKKEIKTAVIYFMNSKDDDFADYFFKEEKNILMQMVQDHVPKIIYLKGENSPFIKMQNNYEFVVVW